MGGLTLSPVASRRARTTGPGPVEFALCGDWSGQTEKGIAPHTWYAFANVNIRVEHMVVTGQVIGMGSDLG